MNKVYLGLGSNVGDKVGNIRKVIRALNSDIRFSDVEHSSLYESVPYGEVEQENFINGVVSFSTNIVLEELFTFTKQLEKQIGRVKTVEWGPREIDIDILLFGDLVTRKESLVIPHKDLLNRDFVLIPLIELNEKLIHPIEKKKLKSFLSELNDKYIISKINFSFSELKVSDRN